MVNGEVEKKTESIPDPSKKVSNQPHRPKIFPLALVTSSLNGDSKSNSCILVAFVSIDYINMIKKGERETIP